MNLLARPRVRTVLALWFALVCGLQEAVARQASTREVSTFRFMDLPAGWIIALVIVPAVILVVTLVYRREGSSAPPRIRALCGVLRGLAFLLLFLFLFRPVIETHEVEVEKAILPILLDGSSSMGRTDAYADEEVAGRLARLAGMASGDELAGTSRLQLMRAILKRPETDPTAVLGERNEVKLYSFGEEVRSLAESGDLRAEGNYTRLGSAIAEVLAEFGSRGQHIG
ncbi:MAG: hypothetical protein V2A76_01305, partial [Planctomycetota bacterium]